MKRLLKLAPIALLLPTLASAAVTWKGDLETGNLSQWDREQSVASNRLMVVNSPVHEGRYSLKVTVRQGDNPISASGNRNEVVYLSREASGSEYFYKWSTLFPSSFPRSKKWALFTQWHHEGTGGSPPLEMYVVDDVMSLRVGGSSGEVLWNKPLQREHWNDFVLHVKWSSDKKTGFIELYHDGKIVVPKHYVATQFAGQRNYLKLGLYRDASIAQEGVVYHDGFMQATSLADVLPTTNVAENTSPEAAPAPELSPLPGTGSEVAANPEMGPPADDGVDNTASATPSSANSAPGASDLAAGTPTTAMTAQSCGASATGGTPLLFVVVLSALAMLSRRKAPALARSQARRTTRR